MTKVVIVIITTFLILLVILVFFNNNHHNIMIETMVSNNWSPKTIKKFLIFQKNYNPTYRFDISILQQQATQQDVEYLLQNNKWPWTSETKKQFKDAISHNEIIRVDPGIALDQAQSVYNETAIKEILFWNTNEGKFLLYGVTLNDGNIARCSSTGKNMELIKKNSYGTTHFILSNNDLETIIPNFKTINNQSCNPCGPLNDPPDYSCPFSFTNPLH